MKSSGLLLGLNMQNNMLFLIIYTIRHDLFSYLFFYLFVTGMCDSGSTSKLHGMTKLASIVNNKDV